MYRIEQAPGRSSILGATIRKPDDIPENLGADKKHTWLLGGKVYVATTVGNDCILDAEIAEDAGEAALTDAYNVFKKEAQCAKHEYRPETVNINGWKATRNSWSARFASVTFVCCFLHIFIKIRDRAKRKYKSIFDQAATRLREYCHADSKYSFSQRIRRMAEWCEKSEAPDVILNPVKKLRQNIVDYSAVYHHPNAHRTSNMADRLTQRMDRHLFSTQYFHGTMEAADLSIRGWALIQNFAPWNPRTVKKHHGLKSPAERLNRFSYDDSWLQNLLISASLGGYRTPPQNPL